MLPKPAKRNPFVTTNITKLGNIEQIEKDNPVMQVPFQDGRSLVFQAKKVETSSKFMILNCKATKGYVSCKVSQEKSR